MPTGIHKIKHVIIVMQENRSFDSYSGTYPGADGFAVRHGSPVACVPNPAGGCTRPYHDVADVNGGGPHGAAEVVLRAHRVTIFELCLGGFSLLHTVSAPVGLLVAR